MPGRVEGEVVSVTDEGGLVTNITAEQLRLAPRDTRTVIRCDEHETNGLFPPDHKEPPATFLALLDESGLLQLVIVGESARDMLSIRPGAKVEVKW